MRFRSFVVVLVLIAAACGGGSAVTTVTSAPSAPAGSVTEAPDSTEAPGATEAPDTTAGTVETEAPRTDGTPAPDFTTILADGSTFSLGEHDKPLYLVFWAEW